MPEWEEEASEQEAVTRSFWSGTITFGLVSIPVALYAANRSQRISLRMVGPEGTPLNRRYFASRDDRELDADEIVRGYETEKDKFVIVDDEELERLAPERTRDIDLRQFVDVSEIDPMYFERAYYLTPNGQSTKAYRLLARVMEDTGRAGIATFVMRAKEYLVAIMAENGILRAETLRFADELRTPETVGLPEPVKPDAAELKKIDREIGKLVETSLPRDELEDRSADRLMKVIRAKERSGEGVVHPGPRDDDDDRPSDIIDLMEILKRRMQGEAEEAASGDDNEDRPTRKPAAKKPSARKTAAKKTTARKTASKTPAKKTTASKSAAKKPAAKKTTAGKTAAKKPAAKKPASKKPASKKKAA